MSSLQDATAENSPCSGKKGLGRNSAPCWILPRCWTVDLLAQIVGRWPRHWAIAWPSPSTGVLPTICLCLSFVLFILSPHLARPFFFLPLVCPLPNLGPPLLSPRLHVLLPRSCLSFRLCDLVHPSSLLFCSSVLFIHSRCPLSLSLVIVHSSHQPSSSVFIHR